MNITLDFDESDYELKKPEKGMMWVGTCIYCAQDAPIDREHSTTLQHLKGDGRSKCDAWDIEPAELNREEMNENIQECREEVKMDKMSLREIRSHYGRNFRESDALNEIARLEKSEAELALALSVKEKIKGRTGKPEKRLRQIPAPPIAYGTCQCCLEKLPLRPFSESIERHGIFNEEDEYVEECWGSSHSCIEVTDEDIVKAFKGRVVEVSAREMALDRDLIDDEKLKRFHNYLERCRAQVDELEQHWKSKGRNIHERISITDGEIKTRALEVAYKQKKRENAIERYPDMAEFTYEAMRKKKMGNVSTLDNGISKKVNQQKTSNMLPLIGLLMIAMAFVVFFIFITQN